MLDEDFREISCFNTYVHPQFGQIDYIIENLTGISDKDVCHVPELSEALEMFLGWINGRECRYYAWSRSDWNQLFLETGAKGLQSPEIVFLKESIFKRLCKFVRQGQIKLYRCYTAKTPEVRGILPQEFFHHYQPRTENYSIVNNN